MKKPANKALAPKQLEVMSIVWDRGEVSVADVWKVLAGRREVARNTVQTTMVRLHKLGWLRCRVDGQTHRYSAAVPEQKATSTLLSRLLHGVFGGSPSRMVLALLDGEKLSPEEASRIRALIDRTERAQK